MKTENVLIFTKNSIYIYFPKNPKYKGGGLYADYTISSIPEILSKIRKDTGINHFGILLNNEISYIIALQLSIPAKLDGMRSLISSHIPEKIPSMSENLVWDYKIVKEGSPENIQVAGVDKEFVEAITDSVEKAHVKIDFIEPLCYSFTKIPKAPLQYFLIYCSKFEKIITFIRNGIISNCQNITDKPGNEIKLFADYIRAKYDVSSQCSLYIDDQAKVLSDSDLSVFTDLGLKLDHRNLSEILFVEPEDIKIKKDEDSLNLSIDKLIKHKFFGKQQSAQNKEKDTKDPKKKSKRTMIILVAMLFLFLVFAGLFIIKYLESNGFIRIPYVSKDIPKEEIKPTPTLTEEIKPTPVPTESAEDKIKLTNFKGYKLEILNGSGIKGEADKIKELVLQLEFDDIAIGNASTYNYQETEVYFKSNDLYRGIELIDGAINSYSILFSETLLPEDYPYDVKIIVGKLKADSIGVEE